MNDTIGENEHHSNLKDASVFKLAGTGILFGVIHVLTGPDHLSALATLSVGSSWKSFALGIRWGCGHSIGLIVIAVIFLSLDGHLNLKNFSIYTDAIVGLFMIFLGIYGVRNAFMLPRQDLRAITVPEIEMGEISDVRKTEIPMESPRKESNRHFNDEAACLADASIDDDNSHDSEGMLPRQERQISATENEGGTDNDSVSLLQGHEEKKPCSFSHYLNMKNESTQKCAALCIGIVHGVAGPGGILGVLPAVGLHDWIKAFVYLGSFCCTSIFIMGMFAAAYGEATGRLSANSATIAFWLSLISSMLSVVVGVMWIVLLALGKLQDVFG